MKQAAIGQVQMLQNPARSGLSLLSRSAGDNSEACRFAARHLEVQNSCDELDTFPEICVGRDSDLHGAEVVCCGNDSREPIFGWGNLRDSWIRRRPFRNTVDLGRLALPAIW